MITVFVSGRLLTFLTRHALGVARYRWLLRAHRSVRGVQYGFRYYE